MGCTKRDVLDVVDTYVRAWVGQDPDLIVTIFTDTATYHERVLDAPIRGRDEIRQYWQSKVVESQNRITCTPLNVFLDGNTAVVEWEAEFDDLVDGERKRMREIAVLVFDGTLVASLREYWTSKRIGGIAASPAATG